MGLSQDGPIGPSQQANPQDSPPVAPRHPTRAATSQTSSTERAISQFGLWDVAGESEGFASYSLMISVSTVPIAVASSS